MDCRAVSLFFRQALARGTAFRSGGGLRVQKDELLKLMLCFEPTSKRVRAFCSKFCANPDVMRAYNSDGVFIDAAGMVDALRAFTAIDISWADVLNDLGPAEVVDVSDDDSGSDLHIVVVQPEADAFRTQILNTTAPLTDDAFRTQILNATARSSSIYTSMGRDALIAVLGDRDRELESIRLAARKRQSVCRVRLWRQHKRGIKKRASVEPDALDIVRRGKKKLTTSAIVAVALRRNLSNISSEDFGKVVLADISRQTVTVCI